jgi:hypothetical protein
VCVKIPEPVEQSINDAVTRGLATELGDRGLLLRAGDLAVVESETTALGARLLNRVIQQCYSSIVPAGVGPVVQFEQPGDVARIGAALAFGAVAAAVFASTGRAVVRLTRPTELCCATFNLGIGVIDGVCDGNAETGERLLKHIQGADLVGAALQARGPGWLRDGLPASLAADHSVAFVMDLIEAFFETLHVVYPGEIGAHVRSTVGDHLALALESEARSVCRSLVPSSRGQLIECSRRTSVLPFEIIETLATGGPASCTPSAGTLLGEAMWRIDDLVDLCQDARRGALNGVLLAATEERPRHAGDGERYHLADIERLLASSDIASAATKAAASLLSGLGLTGDVTGPPQRAFLLFVQRYAAIPPQ